MAKHADDAEDNPPPKAKRAKKRKGSAVQVKARRRRARKTTTTTVRSTRVVRQNPSGWGATFAFVDDLKSLGAGLGAYGSTRLVQRLATKIAAKKKPAWTKHVHAATGAAVFAAAVLASRRVRALDPYHEAIVIGSGVAAVQGVVGAYIPRFAWLMSGAAPQALPAGPAEVGLDDDDDTGDYLENQMRAMERQQIRPGRRPVQQALSAAAAVSGDMGLEESLVEELGAEAIDDLFGGIFENPTLLSTN